MLFAQFQVVVNLLSYATTWCRKGKQKQYPAQANGHGGAELPVFVY